VSHLLLPRFRGGGREGGGPSKKGGVGGGIVVRSGGGRGDGEVAGMGGMAERWEVSVLAARLIALGLRYVL